MKNNQPKTSTQTQKKPKENRFFDVLIYFISIFLFISSFGALTNGGFLAFVFLFLSALIILPSVSKKSYQDALDKGKPLPKFSIGIASLVLFFLGIAFIPKVPSSNNQIATVNLSQQSTQSQDTQEKVNSENSKINEETLKKEADKKKEQEAQNALNEKKKLADSFVGKEVPYEKESEYGKPITQEATDGKYFVGYFDKIDISYVSVGYDDKIIFAAPGKNSATEYKNKIVEERRLVLEKGFSGWDGSHIELTKYIKNNMNDPKSFEHVSSTYSDAGDYLVVIETFRGKNAFGGTVTNSVKAKCSLDGKVLEIMES